MTTPAMLRQLRHDVWATEQVIALCRGLKPAQLDLSVPGTYGSVRRTLAHIVSSAEGYLLRVLGALLHDPPFRSDADVTLETASTPVPHERESLERLFAQVC